LPDWSAEEETQEEEVDDEEPLEEVLDIPPDQEIDLETIEPVREQLFENVADHWDYEREVKSRTDQAPYIIHKDEFYNNEENYAQVTLTYFAGDDMREDQDEKPVYNYGVVTGPLEFGHGSGDQNVVHVRNHQLKAEFEIIRDSGHYAVEILG